MAREAGRPPELARGPDRPEAAGAEASGLARLRADHERTLWTNLLCIVLGVWLVTSPGAFGYDSDILTASDLISGVAVILLGLLSLAPQRFWASWAICAIGVWLLFAPLIFWAPTAAIFANNMLVGSLLILLTVLVPGLPGQQLVEQPGPEVPPGWSYNPSSWLQRLPIISFGLIGFFIARYLAAYQLGYRDTAWDPLFGDGTQRVLESDISRAFPVSDAGLGAMTYLLEILVGSLGGPRRWRTSPWTVMLFGVIVVPLGVTSIVLVILQPVGVGAWCTLCLVAAFAMLIMVPLAIDEVVAAGQLLARRWREGTFWRTFWFGDTVEGPLGDPGLPPISAPIGVTAPAMLRGVTFPWTVVLAIGIGCWVMAAPAFLGSTGWAAASDHLAGAVVVTVAAVALAEVTRAARALNVLLGLWVIVAPWLLPGATDLASWSNLVAGAALIAVSLPRGRIDGRYGSWEAWIR